MKLFGTDGIRGLANEYPMDPETITRIALCLGSLFRPNGKHRRVVIAKDTRLSGYMIEPALTTGFISAGMNVFLLGPIPTPALAILIQNFSADLGLMITASHNPYHDNGIKVFGADGFKIPDEMERTVEQLMAEGQFKNFRVSGDKLGKAKRSQEAVYRYIDHLRRILPTDFDLHGIKVVSDGAHGAAYYSGGQIFEELNADVIKIGSDPNGTNINEGCGSTHPDLLREAVLREKAHIGFALDGDGDRLIAVDERGDVIDGDDILATIATDWLHKGLLKGGGVVTTVMSNLGLEKYLGSLGLTMPRTKVGDRSVSEHMRAHGFNLGGEQSGHMLFPEFAKTGDGILAALLLMVAIQDSGKKPSEACHLFEHVPQLTRNIRRDKSVLDHHDVVFCRKKLENEIAGNGRLLVRASGTEPIIRVMVEHHDEAELNWVLDTMCNAIESAPDQLPQVA